MFLFTEPQSSSWKFDFWNWKLKGEAEEERSWPQSPVRSDKKAAPRTNKRLKTSVWKGIMYFNLEKYFTL